ncbi:aminotransferase class V-fold PLP-dependent enzyme [Virgibacillus kekensis]|uniref:Aminotransferase class V-fold PLP-dependent enzyme n=1 Tax=Virgibacillus kekensis TaxID=202261 RepID=A0ABV9DEY5_9BACI
MNNTGTITYSIANQPDEMNQIYQLNYETFVEEIPQHETNQNRVLIDRFHDENTYIIAKHDKEVIGMIAVRGNRPFSLDQKLESLDSYLPFGSIPCEIRLLSIKEPFRGSKVFYGLCERLVSFCLEKGYTLALISGTTRQLKLYRHIGFKPFGPLVGDEDAQYQPMYLTKQNFERSSKLFKRLIEREEKKFTHTFLPGPVPVNNHVEKAWNSAPLSHRDISFINTMKNVQYKLSQRTNANFAEIVVGTGTMANEMIAAQLSRLPGKGLILVNGEFGERLVKQSFRWNLSFYKISKDWNTPITGLEVNEFLNEHPGITWIWHVHCETSTGYIFPLEEIKHIAGQHNIKLCLDACSSIGVFPVDLSGVYLASTVSGKGIASYPGLAILFHEKELKPDHTLPTYLDIGTYQQAGSVPFTHSSNSLLALEAALKNPVNTDSALIRWIRETLASNEMAVLGDYETCSPGVITIEIPSTISSRDFGDILKDQGIHVSYESGYLLERNWVQIALMGIQKEAAAKRAVNIITQQFNIMTKGTVVN